MLKSIIYTILCNPFTGWLIESFFKDKIPNLRYKNKRFTFNETGVDKTYIASLFWGFYEAAEIRFIEKYFMPKNDVIEFGASSGVISSHIISKLKTPHRLIAVEANPFLRNTWEMNVKRHNQNNCEAYIENCAISYVSNSIMFEVSSNPTASSISKVQSNQSNGLAVACKSLSDVISTYGISQFTLFCDIEGAEVELIELGYGDFENCTDLFIELHQTKYDNKLYTINDITALIQNKLKLDLVDSYGAVRYFKRTSL